MPSPRVLAMFRRQSEPALLSDASNVSSLGVTSSLRVSAARFSRGPQYPHWAACFNSSLVSPSGSRPAATSNHLPSATQLECRRTLLGTPIFEISLCKNWCICNLLLQIWQDSTDVGPLAGPAPRAAPNLPRVRPKEPIMLIAVKMFVECTPQQLFPFNTILRGEI